MRWFRQFLVAVLPDFAFRGLLISVVAMRHAAAAFVLVDGAIYLLGLLERLG